MSKVRSKDTKPEMVIRRRLWARGFRYRVHHQVVGRPDLAFLGPRVAVFIDGDFWHGNAHNVRGLDSLEDLFPSRTEWWVSKIQGNMERDVKVTTKLEEDGWTVLRFWASRVHDSPEDVVDAIAEVVSCGGAVKVD